VKLAREQHPDAPWLADALALCRRAVGAGSAYVHFASAEHANRPGAEWQYRESMDLDDPEVGMVVVDVLQDGRIGGIELVGLLAE
jgi:hypothetical protein